MLHMSSIEGGLPRSGFVQRLMHAEVAGARNERKQFGCSEAEPACICWWIQTGTLPYSNLFSGGSSAFLFCLSAPRPKKSILLQIFVFCIFQNNHAGHSGISMPQHDSLPLVNQSNALSVFHTSHTLPTKSGPGFNVIFPGFQPDGVASAPSLFRTN